MRHGFGKPSSAQALTGSWRTAAVALGASIAVGAGASTSLAATGAVYYDASDNAAAAQTLFNGTFTGTGNVGLGRVVMPSLTGGSSNTAIGDEALFALTAGTGNTAVGLSAMRSNTTGFGNVAIGEQALFANTSGGNNIAIGQDAGDVPTTGSENITIGNSGLDGDSGVIRIGVKGEQTAAYIAGIRGASVTGKPKTVIVDKDGKLGTKAAPSRAASGLKRAVRQLTAQVESQQHEIDRLRKRVAGG